MSVEGKMRGGRHAPRWRGRSPPILLCYADGNMALVLTIALIVVLVGFRLLLPPVPGLLRAYLQRWGKRTTIVLCTISLACAAIAILALRR